MSVSVYWQSPVLTVLLNVSQTPIVQIGATGQLFNIAQKFIKYKPLTASGLGALYKKAALLCNSIQHWALGIWWLHLLILFSLSNPLICMSFQDKSLLLYCSICASRVHPGCLTPPWTEIVTDDWSCYGCKEKVESYLKERDAYLTELSKRCLLCESISIR